MQKGTIAVTTENIFPIIKKFLYSDHEIFLRELVSNAVDATQKLRTLASIGTYQGDTSNAKVRVAIDKEKRTLTISDDGIGLTADEVKKYITQIIDRKKGLRTTQIFIAAISGLGDYYHLESYVYCRNCISKDKYRPD